MARVRISVPDDVLARARAAGLNISGVASAALAEDLDRLEQVTALRSLLADLEDQLGPVPQEELAAAQLWAADLVGVPAPGVLVDQPDAAVVVRTV